MTLHTAMLDACHKVGIIPPQATRSGEWVKTPVEGKAKSNGSGRVMLFDDNSGGVAYNWVTGHSITFRHDGGMEEGYKPPPPDPEKARRLAEKRAEVAALCEVIVARCEGAEHGYFAKKGFPNEKGLVIERGDLPPMSAATRKAVPDGDGPLLVVPGRIGGKLATVQFITEDGTKKNILGGAQRGACHRLSQGREIWVCEGIATAMSVRAALRLLGRSVSVYSAFSAANVATVAKSLRGAVIAADHDRKLEQFDWVGTGEYHAAKSGCRWCMPPDPGDFNDWHMRDGLRPLAVFLGGLI